MGQKLVDTCDIFKTLQPKGLRVLTVRVLEDVADEPGGREPKDLILFDVAVAVGDRGAKRVLRIAKSATKPYASTQTATVGKAGGDA